MSRLMVENPVDGLGRRDSYDVARGLAYVLMCIAHTAPSDGPARILVTSEFLTAPLFALLVGCGVELGRRANGGVDGRFVAQHVVRGLLVVGLGCLLMLSHAQVMIVLVHLGVLIAVLPLLSALRRRWLAPLIALLVVASVAAQASVVPGAPSPITWFGSGPYYPLAFLAYALAGVCLVRWAESRPRASMLLGSGIVLLVFMLGCIVAPNLLGHPVHAYDGSFLETLGNLAGAAGIVVGCVWLECVVRVPAWLTSPGRAALTLYTLHVAVLHCWSVVTGLRDDSWWMVGGLIVGGCGFAILWPALVRGRFRRGPLEGLLSLAQAPLRR